MHAPIIGIGDSVWRSRRLLLLLLRLLLLLLHDLRWKVPLRRRRRCG